MEGFVFFDGADGLEIIDKTACIDCQSIEWNCCNKNEHGQFHQCDLCHKWDDKEHKLVRILHS